MGLLYASITGVIIAIALYIWLLVDEHKKNRRQNA